MALGDGAFAQRARTFLTEPTWADQAGLTPQDADRRRALAEALMSKGMSNEPVTSIPQGISNVLSAYLGGLNLHRADVYDAAQQQAGYDALRGVAGQIGGPMQPIIDQLLGNPQTADMAQQILGAQIGQMMTPPASPDPTSDMQNYQFAVQNGYGGTFDEWVHQGTQSGEFRPLTDPQERAGYGIPAGDTTPYQVGPDNRVYAVTGGGQTINVGAGETATDAHLGGAVGDIFAGMIDEGIQAMGDLAQINRLQDLLQQAGGGGIGTVLTQFAGNLGIDLGEQTDAVQAAQAIIAYLVPRQRVPGSGVTSDFDARMFQQSLPQLMNQPGGNQLIIETMQALAQFKIDQAAIAMAVATHELTPQEGLQQIQALADPFAAARQAGVIPEAQAAPQAPAVGTVEQGYRFMGGNPADPNNWEAVQ